MTIDGQEIWMHSSYEVKLAKSLDENFVKWIRPEPLIWLDEVGKSHRYYPDFYLIEYDIYLDPKNDYLIKTTKHKTDAVVEQNKINLLVLDKDFLVWEAVKALIGLLK